MSNESSSSNTSSRAAGSVISFGTVLATVISYCTWKSIGWAILHGLLGWIYVLYYIIKY